MLRFPMPPGATAPFSVAVLVVGLSGCGSAPEATPEITPPVRLAVASDVVTLDPHLHDELATGSVLGNLFEGLVGLDPEMRVVPLLAERWENPDDLTWRFTLRSDVRFHDGRPMTAEDVRSSLERAGSHPESRVAGSLVAVDRVEIVEANVVDVVTSRPYPVMLNKFVVVAIVPSDSPQEITEPIGTGPYRFGGREPGHKVSLVRADGYWGGAAPWPLAEVEVVADEAERVEALKAGRFDLVATLTPSHAVTLGALPGTRFVARRGLDTRIIGVNFANPVLADLRVREAISAAVDRAAIIREILLDQAEASGQHVSPNVFGYDVDLEASEHAPERARELLTDAAVGEVELTLLHPPGRRPEAEAIAASVTAAGLPVQAVERAWSDIYQTIVAGEWDLFLARYECSSGDASDVLDAAIHTHDPERGYGVANYSSFSNPDLDRLIEQAGSTLLEMQRRQILAESIRLAARELPFIPLWHDLSLYGASDQIEWTPRLDGRILFAEITRPPSD